MNKGQRSLPRWGFAIVLGALVAVNLLFWVLVRTGGPLMGAAFYLVLLVHTWRGGSPGNIPLLLGGIAGFIIHILEVILLGWTQYSILLILNLILPLVLVTMVVIAGKEA